MQDLINKLKDNNLYHWSIIKEVKSFEDLKLLHFKLNDTSLIDSLKEKEEEVIRLINNKLKSLTTKEDFFIDVIVDNKWANRELLRKEASLVGISKNKFAKEFIELLPKIKEILNLDGKILEEQRNNWKESKFFIRYKYKSEK